MKKLIALMPFSLAIACGGPQAEAPEITTDNIVRGTPTSGTPAVVSILATAPGADGSSLCTGTVIAPQVVLTAAHCVTPELVGEGATYTVLTGHDITNPETRGEELEVAAVDWDLEFNPNNLQGGHDIAVVLLAEPTDIEPMPYRRTPLSSDMRGDDVRLIGFGLSDGFNQTGAGVKREATLRLNGFDERFVRTGSLFGRNICNGDSGGPVLMEIDGEETVIGVNSFGFIWCILEASSTRVDTLSAYVDQFID